MANFNATPLFNYIGSELGNMINNVVNVDTTNMNKNSEINNVKYYKNIDETNIYLCLEIPGFLKENCSINLTGGYLIFEGKSTYNYDVSCKFEQNDFNFIKNKNVKTRIDLSNYNIDENNINARYNNGLLKIKLKKKPKMNINID
jgi:HSP20 family molecular chaperone IbpA